MPDDELDRLEAAADQGAMAVYESAAVQLETLASAIYQRQQSRFLRSHSSAGDQPASGWRRAAGYLRVQRTLDLTESRRLASGSMILDGPGGRRYSNVNDIFFDELETEARELYFACTVPGEIGNLDAYADADGLLTDEGIGDAPNTPAYLSHANLSADRANTGGTIEVSADVLSPSTIFDSGYPDQFLPQHKNLYVEIVDSDQPANVGRRLRIIAHQSPLVEDPVDTGLYPTSITVDDTPVYQNLKSVKLDDGGVFSDYTTEAADDTPDDVPLLPAPATPGDILYIGAARPFTGVAVAVTTPAIGTFTLMWQYFDGAFWVAFPFVDGLAQWTTQGEGEVTWSPLTGWQPTVVDGFTAFWVRVRVQSVTILTQAPIAAKLQAIFYSKLEPGTCHWRVLDWRDLGFDLERIDVMSGGRDAILDQIAEERGASPRQTGEGGSDDIDTVDNRDGDERFRQRISELADVVTPGAIARAVSRALEPYGVDGLAIDAHNGFDGLFIDVDALDYYEPGDLYPLNPWKLYTTKSEAFGWFWIVVPCLGDGEFGSSYDEGPTIYLEPTQTFLGPAYDYAVYDGYAVKAAATYASIYSTVDTIRAAGIGFTMLRSCDLNNAAC